MHPDEKEEKLLAFASGEIKRLVTKPKIAGFGLNWQHCNNMIFTGLSDSWESFYQAVRRCWRFGQTSEVNVHVVTADTEGAVLENIRRKQSQHDQMSDELANIMRDYTIAEIKSASVEKSEYMPTMDARIPSWL